MEVNFTPFVAVQPVGGLEARKNMELTIKKPVSLGVMKPYIKDEQTFKRLEEQFGEKGVKVWGVQPGVYNQFTKLDIGSYTVFYTNREFFLMGTVVYTFQDKELAKILWPESVETTFENLYLLSDIKPIKIDIGSYNRVLGYSDIYFVRGFSVHNSEQSRQLIENFELTSDTTQPNLNKESFDKAIEWMNKNSLDTNRNQMGRVEQSFLRKKLFGNKQVGVCCMCGKSFPVQLLVTAHIKKRAFCTLEEKKDFSIVMPNCRTCDGYFELGLISVNKLGEIVAVNKNHPEKIITNDLLNELVELEGRTCSFWNKNTETYFAWHYYHHGL